MGINRRTKMEIFRILIEQFKRMKGFGIVVIALAFQSFMAFSFDPSPLQDFCVAINDARSPGTLLSFELFFFTLNK